MIRLMENSIPGDDWHKLNNPENLGVMKTVLADFEQQFTPETETVMATDMQVLLRTIGKNKVYPDFQKFLLLKPHYEKVQKQKETLQRMHGAITRTAPKGRASAAATKKCR